MTVQLPLGIGLREATTFANYVPGANAAAVYALVQAGEACTYLWGQAGSGRTHLLQAACHAEAERSGATVYLPLTKYREFSPAILEGLEGLSLVCLDDVQIIAAKPVWEMALFHLYNRLRESGARLLAAGAAAPARLGLRLPDLVSRLNWGPVFQLQGLGDEDKLVALQLRARARGLALPDEVGRYLLRRLPRDMHTLFDMLETLDVASLATQRRLTIPFVRERLP